MINRELKTAAMYRYEIPRVSNPPAKGRWSGKLNLDELEHVVSPGLPHSTTASCVQEPVCKSGATQWVNWLISGKRSKLDSVFKEWSQGPGWCGSVDWVPACEARGHWFDSQSGHVPGLQARSPVGGAWEATTHGCFFPSFSLPSPLSKNK